jgi:cytochrome d ubiquinol oxidase subunit II
MWLLARGRYGAARVAAGLAVAAVIWGWGVAQYPVLLPPGLTVEQAAAGPRVLAAMLASTAVGALLLVPALILLYRLFQRPPGSAAARTRRAEPTGAPLRGE